MFDLIRRAQTAEGEVSLKNLEDLSTSYNIPLLNQAKNVVDTQSGQVRRTRILAICLIPTLIGTIVAGRAVADQSDLLDRLKEEEEEVKKLSSDNGSTDLLSKYSFSPSAIEDYGGFSSLNLGYIKSVNLAYIVEPKDILSSGRYEDKMVFTRGHVSEQIPTPEKGKKVQRFFLGTENAGRIYCFTPECITLKPSFPLQLYKESRERGNEKPSIIEQATENDLGSFIDASKVSGQEVFIGGKVKEGRIRADLFSFGGRRAFAYLFGNPIQSTTT